MHKRALLWQVKPANLLLTADLASVKISDFGV